MEKDFTKEMIEKLRAECEKDIQEEGFTKDNIDKMMSLMKMENIHSEFTNQKVERYLNTCKYHDEKEQQKWDNGIKIGGIVIPIAAYVLIYKTGLKFEETGTISSTFVRNLIGNFKFPFKN